MPWNSLEWRASRIEDPVERLRYLRVKPRRNGHRAAGAAAHRSTLGMPRIAPGRLLPGFKHPAAERRPAPPPNSFRRSSIRSRRFGWWRRPTSSRSIATGFESTITTRFPIKIACSIRSTSGPASIRTSRSGAASRRASFITPRKAIRRDFEPDQNGQSEAHRQGRPEFRATQHRCYHFVIDRFGQVFRVVRESDVANHAGNSVWADDKSVYVNLNSSFLGIAFRNPDAIGRGSAFRQSRADPRGPHSHRDAAEQIPHRGVELRHARAGVGESRATC